MITYKSLMEEWHKRVVSDWPAVDYGPDDAVFTKAYGAPVKVKTKPSMPLARSPLALLRDYSNAWGEHGVACPDLVFQTCREGRDFFLACLHDRVGLGIAAHPGYEDGMYIARVEGVNLIWPEK